MIDEEITAALGASERSTSGKWYARGRFISLVPDSTGVGATLPTNHVAIFSERDDAEFVALAHEKFPVALREVQRVREELASVTARADENRSDCNEAERRLDILVTTILGDPRRCVDVGTTWAVTESVAIIDQLRADLAAVKVARDELADIARRFINGYGEPRSLPGERLISARIAELRGIGSKEGM